MNDDDAWGINSPTPGYDPIAPVNVNGGRKRGVSKRAVAVISCVGAAGFLAGTVSQSHGNGAQDTKSPIASPSESPSATPSISASNLTSAIPAWAVPVASSDSYDAWNQKAFIGVVAGYGNPDSPSDKTLPPYVMAGLAQQILDGIQTQMILPEITIGMERGGKVLLLRPKGISLTHGQFR